MDRKNGVYILVTEWKGHEKRRQGKESDQEIERGNKHKNEQGSQ